MRKKEREKVIVLVREGRIIKLYILPYSQLFRSDQEEQNKSDLNYIPLKEKGNEGVFVLA